MFPFRVERDRRPCGHETPRAGQCCGLGVDVDCSHRFQGRAILAPRRVRCRADGNPNSRDGGRELVEAIRMSCWSVTLSAVVRPTPSPGLAFPNRR